MKRGLPLPKKHEWGKSGEEFHTGATDEKGHFERGRDIKFQPWLHDLMIVLQKEIPAYRDKFGNVVRDLCSRGAKEVSELIENPEARARMEKLFQLHIDMEEQAWELSRLKEMGIYIQRSEATMTAFAEMGSWMLLSKRIERLRVNIDAGSLWEPYLSQGKKLIERFEAKLREAKL